MGRTITVIPGDGIGPAVTAATLEVLQAAGAELEFDEQLAGMEDGHMAEPLVAGIERRRGQFAAPAMPDPSQDIPRASGPGVTALDAQLQIHLALGKWDERLHRKRAHRDLDPCA